MDGTKALSPLTDQPALDSIAEPLSHAVRGAYELVGPVGQQAKNAMFDAVYDHIRHMSNALTDGIVKQFPDKFGTGVV